MVHAGAHFCTYGLLYLGPTEVYTIDIELAVLGFVYKRNEIFHFLLHVPFWYHSYDP